MQEELKANQPTTFLEAIMPDQFNVLNWLNNYFPNAPEFNREDIKAVTDFSLMWNLFEFDMGNRNMNIQRIIECASKIADKTPGNNFYDEFYQYFKHRYVNEDNTINNLFEQLRFRPGDKKDFVADVLLDNENSAASKIEAILIILFRLRNNLFHGEKQLHNIHNQYDNFNIANEFLSEILEINKAPF